MSISESWITYMGCLSGGGAKMEDHLPRVGQISRFVFTRYEGDSKSQNLAGTVHMIARENIAKARYEEVITRLSVIDSSNFISERGK